MKEALLYEKLEGNRVRCHLCAHNCLIHDGALGICQVRENRDGTLYTLVYGAVISEHVDPIEKKPLYHVYPGSQSFSIAAAGCNFRCQWCQNADISQMPRQRRAIIGQQTEPQTIVDHALAAGCNSIAYTYTEPTIFFEYAYDVAKVACAAGLLNIFVTNGYMSSEMLNMIHPNLDAANVDLKAFRDETYRRYIGARLEPVLNSLREMRRLGIWIEVTTLIIPGVNDEPKELRDAAHFIATELGHDTPWHLSRFHPAYQMMDAPPTPISILETARDQAYEEGLNYVYLGNVSNLTAGDTHCPRCRESLIHRRGFYITKNNIVEGKCPKCGMTIAGVGMNAKPPHGTGRKRE